MTDSELVTAAFQRAVQKVNDVAATDLTPAERLVCRVVWLRSSIDNGGFPSFFYNSEADFTTETLEALLHIGAADAAQLLRTAVSLFPMPLGRTMDERNAQWDALPADADKVFDKLDHQFYELEPALDKKLAAFVRSHPELLA